MDLIIHGAATLALGVGLGFFGGLFGIGGGIIAIPVFVLGLGMDQTTAQGTALAMMVPNLVFTWWRYARLNPQGFSRQALAITLIASLTTWGVAHLAQSVRPLLLQFLFAGFLAVLGLSQMMPPRHKLAWGPLPPRYMPVVGVLGGSCMGMLGIGGGLVATPVLTGLFGLGQRAAQSIALALATPSAAAALATYAEHGRVDWFLGLTLAVGAFATVSAGVKLAHAWSERTLQRAFGAMLIVSAALLVLKNFI